MSGWDHGMLPIVFFGAFITLGLLVAILNHIVSMARIRREQTIRLQGRADAHELDIAKAIQEAALRLEMSRQLDRREPKMVIPAPLEAPVASSRFTDDEKAYLVEALYSNNLEDLQEALLVAIKDAI